MHTAVKVGLALLVLGVRLWGKLGGIRDLFMKGDMSDSMTIGALIALLLVVIIGYIAFEYAFKPTIWRSAMNRKGISLTPHWQPLLGNYKAIEMCKEAAKNSNEPNQHPLTLLVKEFFTDKEGRTAPIYAINTCFGDHLVINDCKLAEQLLIKHAKSFDKNQAISQVNNDFFGKSWVYQKSSKENKER